jgi:hypothetical protein
VIVRILHDGQFELDGPALTELKRLDEDLFREVAEGDEPGYRSTFAAVLALVRGRGRRLADDRLVESDLILPAPDTTLAEARRLFTDHA